MAERSQRFKKGTVLDSKGIPYRKVQTPGWNASSTGRRTSGWNATDASINALISDQLNPIRRRHRDQVRRNPWLYSGIETQVAHVVGPGVVPLPKVEDKGLQKEIAEIFLDWNDECDADGQADFYGLQESAFRGALDGGETFARFRTRRESAGLAVPLQIQVLEAEFCDETLNTFAPNSNRTINNGIELDKRNKRWAYWLYRKHPGSNAPNQFFNPSERVRVRAEEIMHVYRTLRPGQLRGIPVGAGVLARLYEKSKHDDAVLERSVMAAMLVGFYTRPYDSAPLMEQQEGGTPIDYDTGAELPWLESGTIKELDPGAEVKMNEPPDDNAYSDVQRWALREIAAGLDVTYEQLTGDLSDVSFISGRLGLTGMRKKMEMQQRRVLVWKFCRPAWNRLLSEALVSGALTMSPRLFERNRRRLQRVKWIPQGRDFIDPEKEAKGARDVIRLGLKSKQDIAAEYGSVTAEVDRENQEDLERAEELGLVYDSFPSQVTITGQEQQTAAGDAEPAGADA